LLRILIPRENTLLSRGSLLLGMELPSNPELLCVVRGALSCLTERLEFPEPECHAVVLAVDEALTNIMRHAYQGQRERPIKVRFRRIQVACEGTSQGALEIVLLDEGTPVERNKLRPQSLQRAPIEEVRPGGLGLHFVRESMDKVEFRRRNGMNQLRLLKYLPKGGVSQGFVRRDDVADRDP
jgi:serine/threonine-protein kinase RsbW